MISSSLFSSLFLHSHPHHFYPSQHRSYSLPCIDSRHGGIWRSELFAFKYYPDPSFNAIKRKISPMFLIRYVHAISVLLSTHDRHRQFLLIHTLHWIRSTQFLAHSKWRTSPRSSLLVRVLFSSNITKFNIYETNQFQIFEITHWEGHRRKCWKMWLILVIPIAAII